MKKGAAPFGRERGAADAAGGGGSAAIFNKALKPALSGGGKTIQPRLQRVGNAPLLPTASPPVGGDLLYVYPCANLSCSLHSGAKICPSGVASEHDS